jgi:hypothetical protein
VRSDRLRLAVLQGHSPTLALAQHISATNRPLRVIHATRLGESKKLPSRRCCLRFLHVRPHRRCRTNQLVDEGPQPVISTEFQHQSGHRTRKPESAVSDVLRNVCRHGRPSCTRDAGPRPGVYPKKDGVSTGEYAKAATSDQGLHFEFCISHY